MKSQIKHTTAIILLITMLIPTIFMPFSAYGFDFDGTQSSWAEPELKEAFDLGLTYNDVMNNYTYYITREEFCTLVIKLYEKLSGKTASEIIDPFQDTDNVEILKAYNLGIVKGTSADTFSPDSNITRQEICVMIFRALNVSVPNLNTDVSGEFPFQDASLIASWAEDAMRFAYKNEIMKGLSPDTIDPLSNTTREQGIVLLLRTFNKYNITAMKAEIPVQKGPAVEINQKKKYEFTMNSNNIFFPKFDKRIELYVSTKPGKPAKLPAFSLTRVENLLLLASLGNNFPLLKPTLPSLPSLPDLDLPDLDSNDSLIKPNLPDLSNFQPPIKERPTGPVYTKSDFGAFIDKDGDKVRWFSFELNNASSANKIIYQVASSQFSGFKEGWNTEPTIVYSGEVSTTAKEFTIDFSKVDASVFGLRAALNKNILPQKQKSYYVRAVPVDAFGIPIGDPGKGIAVLYGKPQISAVNSQAPSFELWTPENYEGRYDPEFKDFPQHPANNETYYSPKVTIPRLFSFHGIDDKTKKIIVQVSDAKFEESSSENIIYEKEYTLPVPSFNECPSEYSPMVPVTFSEFGKNAAEMVEKEFINYYIRGIALKESEEPGKFVPSYSDVLTVKYGFDTPLQLSFPPAKYDNFEKINVSVPNITIKGYTEAQWADPNYMEHYYVANVPKPQEITCHWRNVDSGEVLHPYYEAVAFGGQNKAEYVSAISRVLPENAKVHIPPPKEEDKSWYEELFDSVIGFFKDIYNFINKIYSTIKATYDNLKSELVSFVANLCPIPSLRGYFATALEGLINYGLMTLGIPPTLPDFSKLAETNMDYLVDLALTEAGVPQNEVTDYVREEMEIKMKEQFENAGKVKDENPLNAPFLKLDPDYMYRPAYVDIEIANNTDYLTVPGTFELRVQFKINNSNIYATPYDPTGLNLVNDTNQYGYDPIAGAITSSQYRNHFLYGLNGYTVNYNNGDEAVYEVFKPVVDYDKQVIPSIRPHTSQTLRIYLEPGYLAVGSSYPTAEDTMYQDFYNMYFQNGNGEYTWFELSGWYPTAEEYLKAEATRENRLLFLDPKTDYSYFNMYDENYYWNGKDIIWYETTGFTQNLQKPVNNNWSN